MFKTYSYTDIESICYELTNKKAAVVDTDTVMGIISLDKQIIYQVKRRSYSKKIVTFIKDINQIDRLTPPQIKFLEAFWPGQVTIIKSKISYRIPDDPFILLLLSKFRRLYCSSANLSNKETITEISQANEVFSEKYAHDLILVDWVNNDKHHIPSTIIDIDSWKIIREGSRIEEIKSFLTKEFLLRDDVKKTN